LDYLEVNQLNFVIYHFAITPAWVFGFATSAAGTTLVTLVYTHLRDTGLVG
jgi:hypothetical protein